MQLHLRQFAHRHRLKAYPDVLQELDGLFEIRQILFRLYPGMKALWTHLAGTEGTTPIASDHLQIVNVGNGSMASFSAHPASVA